MRLPFILGLAALAFGATVTPSDAGCSVRGRYCDYPTWAANSFEGRAAHVWANDRPDNWRSRNRDDDRQVWRDERPRRKVRRDDR